jgi:hypothetical protein
MSSKYHDLNRPFHKARILAAAIGIALAAIQLF